MTAIVIAMVVQLTPNEDHLDRTEASEPPARTSINALAQAELELPREPLALDVASLQQELSQLADALTAELPDEPTALLAAGLAYSELQQSQDAVDVLQGCVDLGPPAPDAYVGLAKGLTLLGRNEEAVRVLQQAVARQQVNASVTEALAEALALVGQAEESVEVLQQGVRDYPEDAELWLRLGQTQLELQRFEQAEDSIRRAMQCGSRGRPALVALSASLTRQGKTVEAAEARFDLAALQAELKKVNRPGFQHEFTAKVRAGAVQTFCAAAKAFLEQNYLDKAQAASLRAIELDPQQITGHLLLIEACRRQNRLPDVLVVLRRLIELQPDVVAHYANMAKIAARLGDYELAERVMQQADERQVAEGVAH
jgi:tetratricopeptide (TPR) repeat protein